jgi:hypothetical protein
MLFDINLSKPWRNLLPPARILKLLPFGSLETLANFTKSGSQNSEDDKLFNHSPEKIKSHKLLQLMTILQLNIIF